MEKLYTHNELKEINSKFNSILKENKHIIINGKGIYNLRMECLLSFKYDNDIPYAVTQYIKRNYSKQPSKIISVTYEVLQQINFKK